MRLRHARAAVVAALPRGGELLDAGCSDGRLAAEVAAARPDARITGIDIDDYALERARRTACAYPNVRIERGAIGEAARGGTAQVVVCTDVLEHVEDDGAALRWLAACLAPGGALVVHVPADRQLHRLASVAAAIEQEVASGAGPHVRMGYRPEELLALAAAAGLVDADVRWTFHRPATQLAADIDTWTYLRRARAVKLLLLPLLLPLGAVERRPSRSRRGNGLLLVARAPS